LKPGVDRPPGRNDRMLLSHSTAISSNLAAGLWLPAPCSVDMSRALTNIVLGSIGEARDFRADAAIIPHPELYQTKRSRKTLNKGEVEINWSNFCPRRSLHPGAFHTPFQSKLASHVSKVTRGLGPHPTSFFPVNSRDKLCSEPTAYRPNPNLLPSLVVSRQENTRQEPERRELARRGAQRLEVAMGERPGRSRGGVYMDSRSSAGIRLQSGQKPRLHPRSAITGNAPRQAGFRADRRASVAIGRMHRHRTPGRA